MINGRYIPPRIAKMAKRRELTRTQIKAAGLFIYFEHHQWLLWATIGTNFPRGYKVDTSSAGTRHNRTGQSQRKPEGYSILRDLLVSELPFADVALRAGYRGSRRTLHREGRHLLGKCLDEFCELTKLAERR